MQLYIPLRILFQKSVDSGVLPRDRKKANITCIFKKGQKSDPGNYRPVSLTSVICKLLEKQIRECVMDHLNVYNLLSDCQYGFRLNRSTILQLLSVLEDLTTSTDNDLQVDTIYLDFSKAFDSVQHKRLLHKLESFGISGNLLKWFTCFLSNRKQRVVVNGSPSECSDVISGIPQGSIFGPVMFILYVNDLPDVVGSTCQLFADDCKVYKIIASRNDQEDLQKDIYNLCKWSEDWLLKFNIKKCKAVTFGKKKLEPSYFIEDKNRQKHDLQMGISERDLGVTFSENLSFEQHISNVANKANRLIGLIRRKFTYMDNQLFLTLYKSLVRPHLDYGNLVAYPVTKKCKQVIENVQCRAIRLVPELRKLSYPDRLKELSLPSLAFRRQRFDLIQVFKIIHHIDDIDHSTFFTYAESDHLRGHCLS